MFLSEGSGNFLLRRNEDESFTFVAGRPVTKLEQGQKYFGCVHYPVSEKSAQDPELEFFLAEDCRNVALNEIESAGHSKLPIKFNQPEKESYIRSVKSLLKHIHRGDIYEINFCVEFTSENAAIDPVEIFKKLYSISRAPHSCLAKFGANYVVCASPERFLRRTGNHLLTQPIKGTAKRGTNAREDLELKQGLQQSVKERSENIMTVDVARHDLSRIAAKGSVLVDELCGIYSFEQVHQMISTISCELKQDISIDDIISATFPMASMTGAPKIRAMQLIDQFESFQRRYYSGAIGIIDSNGDFDFNVVIRSVFYNSERKLLSFAVGSAITAQSDPEKEWEVCLVKADAMLKVLA
jgi:para-aminobenzoate synthetase component I